MRSINRWTAPNHQNLSWFKNWGIKTMDGAAMKLLLRLILRPQFRYANPDELVGISLCVDLDNACYIPFNHKSLELQAGLNRRNDTS